MDTSNYLLLSAHALSDDAHAKVDSWKIVDADNNDILPLSEGAIGYGREKELTNGSYKTLEFVEPIYYTVEVKKNTSAYKSCRYKTSSPNDVIHLSCKVHTGNSNDYIGSKAKAIKV